MHTQLLDILIAPQGGALRIECSMEEQGQIWSGTLVGEDGERFAIDSGVPRMIFPDQDSPAGDQDADRRSFEAKWARYDEAEIERLAAFQHRWFDERFGFAHESALDAFLAGRRSVLDAGTGPGLCAARCAHISEARVVGMDIGNSVAAAQRRHAERDNLDYVQGDILRPPFRQSSFDFIIADQVLHHTTDPCRALVTLAGLLTPGGHCAFYVYREKGLLRELADDHIVRLTSHLSVDECLEFSQQLTELGRELSRVDATITLERGVPLLGIAPGEHDVQRLVYWHMLKCFWNEHLGWHQSAMINYDWYSPRRASRHTEQEVLGWCEQADLAVERVDVIESGISVLARQR